MLGHSLANLSPTRAADILLALTELIFLALLPSALGLSGAFARVVACHLRCSCLARALSMPVRFSLERLPVLDPIATNASDLSPSRG